MKVIEKKDRMVFQTISGLIVKPWDPESSRKSLSLTDISISLSLMNRFGGHTIFPYSVAAHSLYCSDLAMDTYGRIDLALYLLMHDAAEAYLTDLPKPVKELFPEFEALEQRWIKVINEKFNIPILSEENMKKVHYIDNLAMKVEVEALQPDQTWMTEDLGELTGTIENLTPAANAFAFMTRFHDLHCQLELTETMKLRSI